MPDTGARLTLRPAETAADLAHVRRLFRDYAASLNVSLCFQDFEGELAGLPGSYAPPRGRLLLAWRSGVPAGCVGLRPLGPDVCEMKRLYVPPGHRGFAIGRTLATSVIGAARDIGYTVMRLDTLPRLEAAIALYRSLGFVEIPAYYDNPLDDVRYFETRLQPEASD